MHAERFFQFMAEYNTAIWPVQIIFYALAAFFICTSFYKIKHSNTINIFILSLLWIWNGSVTLLIYFTSFHYQYYLWGPVWVAQGLLICYQGIIKKRIHFNIKKDVYSIAGLTFIAYALIVYPMIGAWLGHPFPRGPLFGSAPCPTVIFTFSAFLFSENRVKPYLLYFPLLWALMSLYPIIGMGVYADIGELIAAIIAFILILKKNKTMPLR
ncbi:MAG: DUF6064 family protein [Pseudodesulfovibrio sp.]